MRFAILYGPHLYASCLFALVASPIPVAYSLKVLGVLGGVLSVVFGIAALVDYIYTETAVEAPEIAQEPILPPTPTPPERQPDRPVRVDEETHAVTWPDATITTTPEEREPYLGQIF